ncbi:MAG: M1 family metallopeptidase [Bacteroidota bacterium]
MRFFLSAIIVLITTSINAQQLFMPRDIKAAYKNETRQMDGRPGKSYWQNSARYNITVTAMPPDRNITGTETISYSNNSPDTLRVLAIKLFLNVHKPGAPRDFPVGEDYLTSGIHIDEVTVDGKKVEWEKDEAMFTVSGLPLEKPLAPNSKVTLGFKWHYEISKQSNREGMIDPTTYFFAYFYPRVAVYDDYNGWDDADFIDSREFYSDFNDYDVTVKVPANYVVWGTGTLQQPEKLLQPAILQRYQQSLLSDDIINIASKNDVISKKVTTQNTVNEWRFTGTNLPDVAFGISDHYVWDGGSVIVDDKTKRRASAQAAYKEEAKDYHHVARYARHSLGWFSHHWPGIAYPYEKTTIFQGFADMEYPMMANNSSFEDTSYSRFVTEHEVVHTYMPFYMGINETRYGMMDEGWATAFEYLIGIDDMGKKRMDDFFKSFRVNSWTNTNSSTQLVPIIVPSDVLIARGFGNNIYGKSAVGYLAMKDLLGDELFKKCLHECMSRWNGKHPTPWDFFYTFNDVSGKNLNWFWNKWFFDASYIDIGIQSVKQKGKQYILSLENIGGMAAPVNVIVNYNDGTKESFHQTPAIWEKDQKTAALIITAKNTVESIVLDGEIFMDANQADNIWKNK